jgi:rhodanese-related sulfurtransferase
MPDPLPEGVQVLDVREHVEWQHGHIEGALHISLQDLPGRVSDVPDGQTLVVCKVGARSAQAVLYLSRLGHDVVNLGGGLVEWQAAGRPLVSETGEDPRVV